MDRKNIIIGLDGATWEIINYLIDENIMPTFGNFKKNGCYGELKSTILPITPAAWTSMMTGCTPPKTGIYSFTKSIGNNNTYQKDIVNGDDIKVPTMWEVLSSYGRNVVSVNVPMTFPPKPVNGIIISGMMTPGEEKNFTYPRNLKIELAENGIDYRIDTYLHRNHNKLQDDDFVKQLHSNGAEIFFKDLNELFDIRKRTIKYLMQKKSWHYFMFVIIGMDRIQHHFWDYIKNPELDFKINDNIKKYYKKIDEFVGEIVLKFRNTSNIFIVSDHGFTKYYGTFDTNGWLLKKGYLTIKEKKISEWKTILKNFLKKYNINVKKLAGYFLNEKKTSKLKLSASNIDWFHTLAYSGSPNGINLNLKGRETLGIVEPIRYDEIREKIIYDFKNITDPNGIKIVKDALKKENVYNEAASDSIPDIILEFKEEALYSAIPSEKISRNMNLFRNSRWLRGNHKRDGILLVLGKDIKKAKRLKEVNIEDIFPTLLVLNDEKVPDYIDGKVIKDIFNKEIKENYVSFKPAIKDKKYQYSNTEEQDLIKKLKSLGYM